MVARADERLIPRKISIEEKLGKVKSWGQIWKTNFSSMETLNIQT
jgi:hypothetical protein